MGNKNDQLTTNVQTMIFDIFSSLKWLERIWKVFCFRFEYKYYRTDTSKYKITWEEFEGIFLDEFKVDRDHEGIDLNEWIIYNTFKKIFEYNNYEIRVFIIYMFFFPYCLHLNGAEGLNFIDLLYEKIIYNLEVETIASLYVKKIKSKAKEEKSSDEDSDENNSKHSGNSKILEKNGEKTQFSNSFFKNGPIAEKMANKSEARQKIKDNISDVDQNKSNINHIENRGMNDCSMIELNKDKTSKKKTSRPSTMIDEHKITGSNILNNLLEKYKYEFLRLNNQNYIRKISFEIFKEIMYIYFQYTIVQLIKAFKEILVEFNDCEYVDDNLVEKVKEIDKDSINLDLFTSKNINGFLNDTYEKKLFGIRNNIKRDIDNPFETFLTFDDIYVYMKNNYYFYNSKKLYYEFSNTFNY